MRFLPLLLIFIYTSTALGQNTKRDKLELEKRVAYKINALQLHITTIADKKVDEKYKLNAINTATRLFIPNSKVEVSSKYSASVIKRPIKAYLHRLRTLNYTDVKITYTNIARVSDFKQGPDGKWYGTATIYQKFTGFGKDGQIKYQDTTTKDIAVVAEKNRYWDIYLGDIKAHEPK